MDLVAIQVTGGKSCLAEESRDAVVADIRHNVDNSLLVIRGQHSRMCECGYAGAGWKRVAFLNMTDPDHNCPGEWQLRSSPRRTCERRVIRGCSLAAYSSPTSYSEVCGRIIGYQYGSTDALYGPIVAQTTPDQASSYDSIMDGGILLTHGSSPRKYIWTLFSGSSQQALSSLGCPCNVNSGVRDLVPLSWPGHDFFCDSATVIDPIDHHFYVNNPLWDGVGCNETLTTCCQFNNPPWFCKQLPQPTSDDIELRLCADSDTERTPIELMEIYIQWNFRITDTLGAGLLSFI